MFHVIRTRDKLCLQGQEVIIDEVRVKRTRKKVAIDSNSKFVRVRDIKEAQDQQDVQKAAWALKDRAVEARKTVLEMQNKDQQTFMFVFSVVDMQNVDNLQQNSHNEYQLLDSEVTYYPGGSLQGCLIQSLIVMSDQGLRVVTYRNQVNTDSEMS